VLAVEQRVWRPQVMLDGRRAICVRVRVGEGLNWCNLLGLEGGVVVGRMLVVEMGWVKVPLLGMALVRTFAVSGVDEEAAVTGFHPDD